MKEAFILDIEYGKAYSSYLIRKVKVIKESDKLITIWADIEADDILTEYFPTKYFYFSKINYKRAEVGVEIFLTFDEAKEYIISSNNRKIESNKKENIVLEENNNNLINIYE